MILARRLLCALPLAFIALPSAAQSPYCYSEEAELVSATPGFKGATTAFDGDVAILGDQSFGDYGAAAIFRRSGATWTEEAFIVPTASPSFGESFGVSVDIEGDTAVIGAWEGCWDSWGPVGCAYIYTRTGGTWTFSQKLSENVSYFSFYGAAVAVSGDTMAISADYASRVFIYVWDGTSWVKRSEISGPNSGAFGGSLALERGTPQSTLLVGAPLFNLGGFTNTGAAYAYVGNGANWALQGTFKPGPQINDRYFGGDVSLAGDTALIGARGDRVGMIKCGAAYAYRRNGSLWSLEEKITPPNPHHDDLFGSAVSLSNNQAVIGAQGEDIINDNRGNLYFVYRTGTTWHTPTQLVPNAQLMTYAFLGWNVAMVGETIIAGNSPSVRVFEPKTRVGTSYCTCTNAPCGNVDTGAGCANSTGQGSVLTAQGGGIIGDEDLVVTNAVPGVFGLFFQGDVSIQVPFGDGQLCASQNIIRLSPLPTQVSPDGSAMWGPCVDDPSIPAVTGVVPGSGETKRYQFWYRDPGGPCGNGFNTTNGVELTW